MLTLVAMHRRPPLSHPRAGAGALQLENARLREELDGLKRRLTRSESSSLAGAGLFAPPQPEVLQELAKVRAMASRPVLGPPALAVCQPACLALRALSLSIATTRARRGPPTAAAGGERRAARAHARCAAGGRRGRVSGWGGAGSGR
jgi:hypothetical protein